MSSFVSRACTVRLPPRRSCASGFLPAGTPSLASWCSPPGRRHTLSRRTLRNEDLGGADLAREEFILPSNACFGCGEANSHGLQVLIYQDPDASNRLIGEFIPG